MNTILKIIIGGGSLITATASVVTFLAFILYIISHHSIAQSANYAGHIFVTAECAYLIGALLGVILGVLIDKLLSR